MDEEQTGTYTKLNTALSPNIPRAQSLPNPEDNHSLIPRERRTLSLASSFYQLAHSIPKKPTSPISDFMKKGLNYIQEDELIHSSAEQVSSIETSTTLEAEDGRLEVENEEEELIFPIDDLKLG